LGCSEEVLVWSVCSLVALLVSLWLIVRGLTVPVSVWSAFPMVVFLLMGNPLREHLSQGQLNLALLALLTGAWAAERSGRPGVAGIFLGVATALKLFPGFLFLYFALMKQWRLVLAGGLALLAVSALTVGILGVESYQAYVSDVLPRIEWFRAGWNNSSLVGFWSKL